ncbi:SDR family NAD(P)-dependent oxidoreductase [Streptomyces sp. NPDC059883]|uniref:SDR family NAD(P)-dependent oxidoreductase n=1 Tax=unclassified Streptomyces TaxID=2593676 RepID=UPI00364ECF45
MINISSIAGRQAWANYGVRNLTKFGVNGFTESLRQELAQRHVRVSVLEPGAVDTQLGSHNKTPSTPRSSNRSTRGTSAPPPPTSPTGSPISRPGPDMPRSPNSGSCPPTKPDGRTRRSIR